MKEKILGREMYLDILNKRIRGLLDGYRQNIAIVGDELVGKTAIIFKLLNKFSDNRITIIYLEVRHESLASFVRRFIGVLLYNFLVNSEIPLKEDLDFLIKKSAKYIPKTVAEINLILNATARRKRNNVFADLLSLCETFHQETTKCCVVIFDEFHILENLGFKNLYREWSKLLISQKNTMYIVVSSMKFKAKNILSKNLSLLFGNFQVLNVEPFDIKTSEQYLKNKLGALDIDQDSRNFIVHFTGGHPLYLEVISDALLKCPPANPVDALENLLFNSSGILNQRFSNLIRRFLDSSYSNDYISILHLIASGRNKIKDIAHYLRKSKKDLNSRIGRLLELDAVTRTGDFLKINDRVFGFWLRFIYQEKFHSLTFDAKNQKARFRKNIEEMIKEFSANSKRSVIERMTELLHLFENEMIQMERKKVRLNHFREIKPLEFNNRNLKSGLIGRSSDKLWIMAIKNDLVTEDDIVIFAKECKKYRNKPQRKIIITLKDIDMNARLRALEEKIWTWDVNILNQILDLFSKPRVIA